MHDTNDIDRYPLLDFYQPVSGSVLKYRKYYPSQFDLLTTQNKADFISRKWQNRYSI